MDLLYEILFEVYLELMMLIVPEKKASSKKYRIITMLIAVTVLLGVIVLFVWGGVLVFDNKDNRGYTLFVIAIIISVAQIITGVVMFFKKNKQD